MDLFLENEFEVIEHYTSNIYKEVKKKYKNVKYSDRYNKFIDKGYQIVSPNMKRYDEIVKDIYYLLIELYKDFPIFKKISLEAFQEVFKDYKTIINPSMVKLAYFENKMVGFFISVPNYNNCVYYLNNPTNLLKILK